MSRLSREPERGRSAAVIASMEGTESGMTPIEVHVPVDARDGAVDTDAGIGIGTETGATVGGMPVVAAPGESVQHAVLNHLHRLALTAGHPVLAAVRDERIGYVVSVRVLVDGSSEFTGEPRQLDTPAASACQADAAAVADAPERPGAAVATCMVQAVSEQTPLITATSGPAQVWPRAEAVPPGTVQPPTGTFGPPTGIFSAPTGALGSPTGTFEGPAGALGRPSVPAEAALVWPEPAPELDEPQTPQPDFGAGLDSYSAPEWQPAPAPAPAPQAVFVTGAEEAPTEPPVREFDSVAEAVLAPDADRGGPLAEPLARINEAVKEGRITEAAETAERTFAEVSRTLGADHPDVLRLRELTAYVAYLADDPLRSFRLSLDLARLRHRLCDARGAYGNVQSAAAAWRAVRDPLQGLDLGRDLIEVWSELAAGPGPAAHDLGQLERARTRMGRLAERARAVGEAAVGVQ
ncbi:tetratricopeptide repeat protein [Streptomyces sp. NPDC052036]|uniref:tetratricopeptide repeat protein n=1 Tax=unclassified Streptomyces TaxID=2593676 RepID=UPI00341C0769